MLTNIIVALVAALVAVVWIHPRIVNIALLKNIVDNPNARKLQTTPVPVLGGVAIFFGMVLGIALTYRSADSGSLLPIMAACNEPEETCFCGTFGIDAANPAGDISCWIVDDTLFWKANTEKGEAYSEIVASVMEEACEKCEARVEAHKEAIHAILDKLPLKDLNLEGFDGEHLLDKCNSPKWAELSEACLGCGTCTFVCPTCQCYDVRDYDNGNGVQRYRCWDSCMYSEFTKMAHGNNRLTQKERFRQRFMHKLVYYPENNEGLFSCVGCGRCLAKCPISMNIVKVMKKIGGNKDE